MRPRPRTMLTMALVGACLWALPAGAQVFKIGAGSSSLYDAEGGSFEMKSHKYSVSLGVGEVGGKLRLGALLKTRFHHYDVTAGDDTIRFRMPTDIFDGGHYFLGRGVGLSGKWHGAKLYAFGGATSDLFATPFLHVASANQPLGLLFLDVPLSERVQFFSRNVVSRRQTFIQGLSWKPSKKTEAAFAGGGRGQPALPCRKLPDRSGMDGGEGVVRGGGGELPPGGRRHPVGARGGPGKHRGHAASQALVLPQPGTPESAGAGLQEQPGGAGNGE